VVYATRVELYEQVSTVPPLERRSVAVSLSLFRTYQERPWQRWAAV
jgi:hypothetical protein